MKVLLIFLIGIITSSCASYSQRIANSQIDLYNNNPRAALAKIEKQLPNVNELVLRELNLAILNRQIGQFKKSNQHFETAKFKADLLRGVSVSDQLQAVAVNDETIEYQGENYEQLFIHGFSALNYLDLGQPDSARVEMLQAQEKMKQWGKPEAGTGGYLWVKYLAGVIYQQLDEFDNAIISYRQVVESLKALDKTVPVFLQKDLVKLTKQQGLTDESNRWLKEFNLPTVKPNENTSEVVVLFFNGLAPLKRSHHLPTFSHDAGKNINIALPYYPAPKNSIQTALLSLNKQTTKTHVLASVNTLARQTLNDEMAGIITRALVRKAVKSKIVGELDKENNNMLSLISRIAAVATEHADTRSWHTLPFDIQIARFATTAGKHTLTAQFKDYKGFVGAKKQIKQFDLKAGQIKVVSFHWVNPFDYGVKRK